jgi:hypothetical protein
VSARLALVLRDALARVIRAAEAIEDGETDFAAAILDELAADLWMEIEEREREAA